MPEILPKPKPKQYTKILDMLNTKAAANQFSTQTYTDLVLEFSKKAYDNNELSDEEYADIVEPLKGDTGIMLLEQIQKEKDELNKYANGGRIGFLDGGDTAYNAMVTEAYIKAGGKDATGMDIDTFAEEYFKKFNQGGRVNYNEGSPDTGKIRDKVIEIMDAEGLDFGEAFKLAMKELNREANSSND